MELENQNKEVTKRTAEDFELINRAVAGDQKAYALLMERYRKTIFHMMLKMVGNRDDADDLTLEAFAKAFRRLDTFEQRYTFSTWLFRIATNNCIDYIRKKRLNLLSIDETMEEDGDTHFSENIRSTMLDPEENYIRDQKVKLMRSVMKQLPERYRLMIELRFFEDLTYDAIAKELDIPIGTVKAQLFRAKELLYDILKSPSSKEYIDFKAKKKNDTD